MTSPVLSEKELTFIADNYCDPWHVHGSPTFHILDISMINLVKSRLGNRQLPITIGNTGYIYLTSKQISDLAPGWCLDPANRLVFIWDNKLIFQRYTCGGDWMYGYLGQSASNVVSDSLKQQLVTLLEA